MGYGRLVWSQSHNHYRSQNWYISKVVSYTIFHLFQLLVGFSPNLKHWFGFQSKRSYTWNHYFPFSNYVLKENWHLQSWIKSPHQSLKSQIYICLHMKTRNCWDFPLHSLSNSYRAIAKAAASTRFAAANGDLSQDERPHLTNSTKPAESAGNAHVLVTW